jgi:hypothetical protein
MTGLCGLEHSCPTKANQRIITQVMRGALEKVALSDLAGPMQLTAIRDANGKVLPTIVHISGSVQ